MARLSKRAKAIRAKVDSRKLYPVVDAIALVKECSVAKFDESIDVAVQLGVDAKKSDQVVRGSVWRSRMSPMSRASESARVRVSICVADSPCSSPK